MGGGLVSCDEQQKHHAEEFIFAQTIAIRLRLHKLRDKSGRRI